MNDGPGGATGRVVVDINRSVVGEVFRGVSLVVAALDTKYPDQDRVRRAFARDAHLWRNAALHNDEPEDPAGYRHADGASGGSESKGVLMTKVSTMKPFAPGDIFLGCTYLCNPTDDHAGDGRILQYDRNMVPKGTLYTEGTTHLVVNLRFGPDGILWGFDPFAHAVVRVAPTGEQLPAGDFGDRGWGSVCFGYDGSVILNEYLKGDRPYQGGDMRTLEGTDVVGYGRIAKFDAELNKIAEYETDLSPSMTGFHGVTHSAMHPDGRHMAFMTDLGMRVMRIDIDTGTLLPDLIHYPGGDEYIRKWTTGVAYLKDGTLCLLRGSFIDFIAPDGSSVRTLPLDEYGYAMITISTDDRFAFVTNIFTGVMSKVDLESGEIVGTIDTGLAKPSRSLAGVAVFPE